MLLINILSIVLLGVLSLLIVTYLIDFFKNIHKETIEYTKKEYYNKIKSIMIEQIQSELSNLITEDTLAFDIDGLIIAPNLNTNENIKLFKEIERYTNQKEYLLIFLNPDIEGVFIPEKKIKNKSDKITFARHFTLNEKNLNKLKSEKSSKSSTKKNTSNICYILEEVKKLILLKS